MSDLILLLFCWRENNAGEVMYLIVDTELVASFYTNEEATTSTQQELANNNETDSLMMMRMRSRESYCVRAN